MEIYFIRHGETVCNKERRYQGAIDLPLSEEGRRKLCRADFEAEEVFVSTLKRSIETARILFPEAKLLQDPGLDEMHFGDFEGRTADEMKDDPAYGKWVEDNCEGRCPNGESMAEFDERVRSAVSRILRKAAEEKKEKVVIVAHGGTFMSALEGFASPERKYYEWLPGNGAGYVFNYAPKDPGFSLQLVREVSYGSPD